jgi:hypothetical protein
MGGTANGNAGGFGERLCGGEGAASQVALLPPSLLHMPLPDPDAFSVPSLVCVASAFCTSHRSTSVRDRPNCASKFPCCPLLLVSHDRERRRVTLPGDEPPTLLPLSSMRARSPLLTRFWRDADRDDIAQSGPD